MEKFVEIWHPEIQGTAFVSETSFKNLRKPKGWNLVEDDPVDEPVEIPAEVEPKPESKSKKTKLK